MLREIGMLVHRVKHQLAEGVGVQAHNVGVDVGGRGLDRIVGRWCSLVRPGASGSMLESWGQ